MSAVGPRAGRRWMGVGRSDDRDSRVAGMAAARAALNGDAPKLLIVFSSVTHDAAALIDGVRQVAGDVPVIGCSTHGEIGPDGPRDGTVVAAAIGGPGFTVSTATATAVSGRQRAAGTEVARCVAQLPDQPHRVLLLFTDGLVRDQELIVRGCYGVVGASVPLVGGAAAGNQGAYVFGDGRAMADAVVGAAIVSEAPLCVSVRHGWHRVGEPMIVTSSRDGRVYTLDDRPAMDMFLDRLGAPADAYTDADAFVEFAVARPLGVQRRGGIEARNMSTVVDMAGRSISGGCAIDYGSLVWALAGDADSILAATDSACSDALAGLGDHELVGMLTFSCAALRPILGDDGTRKEGDHYAKWANGAPFAGFYTFGEIARIRGIDGFHNQTLAVLAFG